MPDKLGSRRNDLMAAKCRQRKMLSCVTVRLLQRPHPQALIISILLCACAEHAHPMVVNGDASPSWLSRLPYIAAFVAAQAAAGHIGFGVSSCAARATVVRAAS